MANGWETPKVYRFLLFCHLHVQYLKAHNYSVWWLMTARREDRPFRSWAAQVINTYLNPDTRSQPRAHSCSYDILHKPLLTFCPSAPEQPWGGCLTSKSSPHRSLKLRLEQPVTVVRPGNSPCINKAQVWVSPLTKCTPAALKREGTSLNKLDSRLRRLIKQKQLSLNNKVMVSNSKF